MYGHISVKSINIYSFYLKSIQNIKISEEAKNPLKPKLRKRIEEIKVPSCRG